MRIIYFDFSRILRAIGLAASLFLIFAFTVFILIQDPNIPSATMKSYPIYKVNTKEKVVALTFDISWGEKTAGPVLDILKEKKIKATFFISGPWTMNNPEIPKRIALEGHEVASHGYRHIDYDELKASVIKEEISKAGDIILKITGREPNLIRTPNGAYNDLVIETIHQCGYEAIQWSVDSLDWQKPGADAIINRVMGKIHPGAIILMHASDSCPDTPEALPTVIDQLQKEGYKIVTVSELLKYGPGTID